MTTKKKPKKVRGDLSNCPPNLAELIGKEGTAKQAAIKAGVVISRLRDIANGSKPMTDDISAKIDKALAPVEAKTYEPWDGKRVTTKTFTAAGKASTFKKCPSSLALLFDRLGNRKSEVARALGYSGFAGIEPTIADNDKYRIKLHNKVMAALAGDPLPGKGGADNEHDEFKTNMALVITSLNDYDRIDEIASILNAHRYLRKNTRAGLLVLYKFPQHEKVRQFKRLASRDGGDIFCP